MDRLVPSPVFVLCPIRSGSTLLRCILNSHTRVCAPHELHVADLEVRENGRYVRLAMDTAGLRTTDLEHLLWDRVLHRYLQNTGKEVIVDKTPGNLLLWQRLRDCWPDARFVFLRRHPARILESALAHHSPEQSVYHVTDLVVRYLDLMDETVSSLPGPTITYEDLTTDPANVVGNICEHLGVPFEPTMLDYGRFDHGPFMFGIGDFGADIRSGRIITESADVDPEDVPDVVRPTARRWGYLPA